jgi:hypothetical protein
MLLNSDNQSAQYFIKLSSGSELGPYSTVGQAQTTINSLVLSEGVTAQIIPRALNGKQVLFG